MLAVLHDECPNLGPQEKHAARCDYTASREKSLNISVTERTLPGHKRMATQREPQQLNTFVEPTGNPDLGLLISIQHQEYRLGHYQHKEITNDSRSLPT